MNIEKIIMVEMQIIGAGKLAEKMADKLSLEKRKLFTRTELMVMRANAKKAAERLNKLVEAIENIEPSLKE